MYSVSWKLQQVECHFELAKILQFLCFVGLKYVLCAIHDGKYV